MIDEDQNFKFAVLWVVALNLQGFNYGEQFFIMSFAPSLCQNHFSWKKNDNVLLTKLRG